MIGYAAAMGRGAGLDGVRAAGWRLMVSPDNLRPVHGLRYALDNGAWGAFLRGEDLNISKFLNAFERCGVGADWVVLPDVVCGGEESYDLTLEWFDRLRGSGVPLMFAVQDGFVPEMVSEFLSPSCGVFVGGSVDWKLATMSRWCALARERGALCHVGRVNTARRVRLCEIAGVDSFDGSGVSRFPSELRRIDFARRQVDMFGGAR